MHPALIAVYIATGIAFLVGVYFDYNRRDASVYFIIAFMLATVSVITTIGVYVDDEEPNQQGPQP